MFIGHFAVGFALKKAEPRVPLGVWFAGVLLLDILWPIFLLLGVEKASVVPGFTVVTPLNLEILDWSHSLVMTIVWSALFGALVFWRVRTAKAFIFTALAVTSHWVLDYVTHSPDMPLAPHSAKYGLGLWNSLRWTLVAEFSLFATGIFLYINLASRAPRKGLIHLSALILFFIVMYIMAVFGPVPPNDQTILATSALALTPVIFWANFVDKKMGLG
jgi:membrane-bound metal-dependent hydrolase YbcI (DUF457 family)